jgi:hypothetical protein
MPAIVRYRRAMVRQRTDTPADPEAPFAQLNASRTCEVNRRIPMLYTVIVVLLILWALGLVTSYTMGGVIHVLLVVALVIFIVNFLRGRKSL